MRYVIVDLEATCWEKGSTPDRMEIIEIGAMLMPSSTETPEKEFSRFVRPIAEPILSDFCRQLTSIQQRDVDEANDFSKVFPAFMGWIGTEPYKLCSWGGYDLNQFRRDCNRHNIALPAMFEDHINLKQIFAQWQGIKQCGMKSALRIMKMPLEGTHHRAIDDARNIAKIAQRMLPMLEGIA